MEAGSQGGIDRHSMGYLVGRGGSWAAAVAKTEWSIEWSAISTILAVRMAGEHT